MSDRTFPDWLYEVFTLDISDGAEASYILQYKLNDVMHEGKFDLIDRILFDIQVHRHSISLMLGLLVSSSWCEDKLIHREMFVKRCRAELIDRGRADVNDLLSGLE